MEEDEILLKEYELCQEDNEEHSKSYWIIFGLFTSASGVVLGLVVPTLISEIKLLNDTAPASFSPTDIWRVFVSLLGLAIILIILWLKCWLDRAKYLIYTNYGRMHEIEAKLGMWKSLRIYVIDKWNRERKKLHFKNAGKMSADDHKKVWREVWKALLPEFSRDDFRRLYNRKERFIELSQQPFPKHRSPGSAIANKVIYTLVFLWVIIIIGVWLPLIMGLWRRLIT